MLEQTTIRQQLLDYLSGRHAHASLEDAIKGLPIKNINDKPGNLPYSFWEILEHIRRTQNDIVDFIQNPNYQERKWPKDYWPDKNKLANKKMWEGGLKKYRQDFSTLQKIVKNRKTDLLSAIPHGQGQNILREVMLVIDHSAYHTGEIIIMRRLLGLW